MIPKVVRPCGPRFNTRSRPALVTNGHEWWVEDSPNYARMLPADNEQAALDIWDAVVNASRPRPRPVPTAQQEAARASDRH